MISAVREIATSEEYWKSLSSHFAEENHANVATQDDISCVKSLCQPVYLILITFTDSQLLAHSPSAGGGTFGSRQAYDRGAYE